MIVIFALVMSTATAQVLVNMTFDLSGYNGNDIIAGGANGALDANFFRVFDGEKGVTSDYGAVIASGLTFLTPYSFGVTPSTSGGITAAHPSSSADTGIYILPTGSVFVPCFVEWRAPIVNHVTTTMSVAVEFTMTFWQFDRAGRQSEWSLSATSTSSLPGIADTFTPVGSAITTLGSGSDVWRKTGSCRLLGGCATRVIVAVDVNATLLMSPTDTYVYVRLSGTDFSGSGSRSPIAFNTLRVTSALPTTPVPTPTTTLSPTPPPVTTASATSLAPTPAPVTAAAATTLTTTTVATTSTALAPTPPPTTSVRTLSPSLRC
jgi:hypothetical protein